MDTTTLLYALGALALVNLLLSARALSRSGRKPAAEGEGEAAPAARANPTMDTQLVAVIAAAVAASSGMAPGSFRVASVEAAPAGAAGGFNTPVWGHVDRLARASQNR